MNPRISVVIATRNRGGSVVRLVRHLREQDLPPQAFEIIVVDDGSPEPVGPLLEDVRVAPRLRTCRIPWSGQGAARHRGATMAEGDILVFVDDDMQIGPEVLAAHLAEHDATPRAVGMNGLYRTLRTHRHKYRGFYYPVAGGNFTRPRMGLGIGSGQRKFHLRVNK